MLAVAVGGFAAVAGDMLAALATAVIGWLILNGMLIDQHAVLHWHGTADVVRLAVLGGAALAGTVCAWLARLHRATVPPGRRPPAVNGSSLGALAGFRERGSRYPISMTAHWDLGLWPGGARHVPWETRVPGGRPGSGPVCQVAVRRAAAPLTGVSVSARTGRRKAGRQGGRQEGAQRCWTWCTSA